MNRDDCEKLLAAYRESVIAGNGQAAQPLFEVIVNIMAGEKKPAYRGGGLTVPNVPITIPSNVIDNKPIVTPLTVETDVANMPSIPNMNSLLREHEED